MANVPFPTRTPPQHGKKECQIRKGRRDFSVRSLDRIQTLARVPRTGSNELPSKKTLSLAKYMLHEWGRLQTKKKQEGANQTWQKAGSPGALPSRQVSVARRIKRACPPTSCGPRLEGCSSQGSQGVSFEPSQDAQSQKGSPPRQRHSGHHNPPPPSLSV